MPDTDSDPPLFKYPERIRRKRHGKLYNIEITNKAFVSYKEKAEYKLIVKLYKEGKITTPNKPFKRLDIAEIDVLFARGVI